MRLRETSLVAAREVRDAVRARWFLLVAAGFFFLSLALSTFGLAGAQRSGLAGFDRTTASLLNLTLIFIPLVTLILGSLGLSGEQEDGALGMLLAHPVTRAEVYTGKLLGQAGAISAAIALGFGVTGVVIGWTAGGGDTQVYLALVAIAVVLGATTLALGSLLAVALASRAKAIGAAFGAWLVLIYLSDLGTIGLSVTRGLGPGQTFGLALLNPVQEARVLGVLALSERLDLLGPAGLFGLDHLGRGGLAAVLAGGLALAGFLFFGAGYATFRRSAVS